MPLSRAAASEPTSPQPAAAQSSTALAPPAQPAASEPAAAAVSAAAAAAKGPLCDRRREWDRPKALAPGRLHHLLREDSQLDAHICAAHGV